MKGFSTPQLGGRIVMALPQQTLFQHFTSFARIILNSQNGVIGRLWVVGILLGSQLLLSVPMQAQCNLLNEHFDANPALSPTNVDGAWYPDRYRPAAFVMGTVGAENVLKISIDGPNDGAASRPGGFGGGFYNTQGRKLNQCGKCVTALKGKIYIPTDWAGKHRRTDMWATAFDASDVVSDFPIIGVFGYMI